MTTDGNYVIEAEHLTVSYHARPALLDVSIKIESDQLVGVIGRDDATEIGKKAARLTGLQQYQLMADAMGCTDGDVADAAGFLAAAFEGMGDETSLEVSTDRRSATLRQDDLRIVRGMEGEDRENMLSCWIELWRGAVNSHRAFMDVSVEDTGDSLIWRISPRGETEEQL